MPLPLLIGALAFVAIYYAGLLRHGAKLSDLAYFATATVLIITSFFGVQSGASRVWAALEAPFWLQVAATAGATMAASLGAAHILRRTPSFQAAVDRLQKVEERWARRKLRSGMPAGPPLVFRE